MFKIDRDMLYFRAVRATYAMNKRIILIPDTKHNVPEQSVAYLSIFRQW